MIGETPCAVCGKEPPTKILPAAWRVGGTAEQVVPDFKGWMRVMYPDRDIQGVIVELDNICPGCAPRVARYIQGLKASKWVGE